MRGPSKPRRRRRAFLTVFAPAKVNWYLAIKGRRPDGFHELETLFVRIPLTDRITLIDRPSGIRIRTTARLPKGPKNLAYQAAALLLKEVALLRSASRSFGGRGVEIRLHKRIPSAAGLGGGSSDAAAVLLGLNRLWRLGFTRRKLLSLGAKIGSDVPFFVSEAAFAVGRGRGEKLKPVKSSHRLWHVLVKPPFGISTRQAYDEYARLASSGAASLTPPKGGVKILVRYLQNRRSKTLPEGFFNSLEVSINKQVKRIYAIKNRLLNGGAAASLLSGSGSTVFGVFYSKRVALQAARGFQGRKGYRVFVV